MDELRGMLDRHEHSNAAWWHNAEEGIVAFTPNKTIRQEFCKILFPRSTDAWGALRKHLQHVASTRDNTLWKCTQQ